MQPDELGQDSKGDWEARQDGWSAQRIALSLLALNVLLFFAMITIRGEVGGWLAGALLLGIIAQGLVGFVFVFQEGERTAGAIALVTVPFLAFFGLLAQSGGGWGRPLRVRGRQLHPELTQGADWTQGLRPDPGGLDAPTRAALEALWLHDAQKEHASVPAFARISWMLAAVGAPAELLQWSQRAALEEIDHARRCFALAAGYGGRSHTVEAMPDLLLAGLDVAGDPLQVLAHESLLDGCQLEDFNADVAAACAESCEEPVTRAVLEQIAREERSHAEFSWAVLAWSLERSPLAVREAIAAAERKLDALARPTAVSSKLRFVVARADAKAMLRHGRLPDGRWGELWQERLGHTRRRLDALVQRAPQAGVATPAYEAAA